MMFDHESESDLSMTLALFFLESDLSITLALFFFFSSSYCCLLLLLFVARWGWSSRLIEWSCLHRWYSSTRTTVSRWKFYIFVPRHRFSLPYGSMACSWLISEEDLPPLWPHSSPLPVPFLTSFLPFFLVVLFGHPDILLPFPPPSAKWPHHHLIEKKVCRRKSEVVVFFFPCAYFTCT